jgi:hypothetical protein
VKQHIRSDDDDLGLVDLLPLVSADVVAFVVLTHVIMPSAARCADRQASVHYHFHLFRLQAHHDIKVLRIRLHSAAEDFHRHTQVEETLLDLRAQVVVGTM